MTDQKTRTVQEQRDTTTTFLIRLGITDSDAAARITDALLPAGFTDDLPTSAHGAAIDQVFACLIPSDRVLLGDLITRHTTDHAGAWPQWLHSALVRAENDDSIETDRATLAARLDDLAGAMNAVHAAHRRLLNAGDIEHIEDALFPHHLRQVDLGIRTLLVVNPTKPPSR